MKGFPLAFTSAFLLVFAGSTAGALPRFATLSGTKCSSCHVDPAGSGMRQAFGLQYGRENLPVPAWSSGTGIEDVSNVIANFLSVGADFRTLYYVVQRPSAPPLSSFYQMQGDLYLDFALARRVSVYFNKGLYNGFQAFGLLTILPARGFIKAGKFVPNFGTRLDDHTAFIRRLTGFTPEDASNRYEKTGMEIGLSPGPLTFTAGVYNSLGNDAQAGTAKAYLGRVEGMFSFTDKFNLGLGANAFTTRTVAGTKEDLYGAFGSCNIGKLVVFGEVDYLHTPALRTTGFISYVEMDYPLVTGLDLKLAYDFYDPSIDLKSGANSRYTVGVEFFPLPGVEVRPLYRFVRETPVEVRNNEFDIVLHCYI